MLTLIGDVHGKVDRYKKLLTHLGARASVQLGDMGFRTHYEQLGALDPRQHRFIPGNHDDYDHLPPHAVAEPFGMATHGGLSFFFLRGAHSLDHAARTPLVDWWPQEELTVDEGYAALALYQRARPALVLTHDAPLPVVEAMGFAPRPTRTGLLLGTLLQLHAPRLWVYGHYHKAFQAKIGDTIFLGLPELGYSVLQPTETGTPILLNGKAQGPIYKPPTPGEKL